MLHGNVAITALRHLGELSPSASSYCEARQRLPLELFAKLFDAVSQMAREAMEQTIDAVRQSVDSLVHGRRVLLCDVTTFSMPDTPALRSHFGYAPGQREGLGFPIGRLLGVMDALSGCILVAMGTALFTHEAREMLSLHPLLKKGDILLADRGFCSYLQIAKLLEHGVDVVMRLHHKRKTKHLRDYIEIWDKPVKCPEWLSPAIWEQLPQTLSIRIVRYSVNGRNGKTKQIYIATTLLDKIAYPPELLQRLYGHRWHIETCFNSLKTHGKMNSLKCTTVPGVIKELIMYLIVWNLVRMTMNRFARKAQQSVWRVSFLDATRWLCRLLTGSSSMELKLLVNPDRPGRWEPRKLKRRIKEYDLLSEPRANLKAKHRARYD